MQDMYHEIAALPVLLPLWSGATALGVVALAYQRRLTPARLLAVVLTTTYLAAVLTLTFFPLRVDLRAATGSGDWLEQLNLLPLATIDAFTFWLNVAMTVPLGILAPLVLRLTRARSAVLVGLSASAAIEGLQLLGNLVLGSGRVVDVNDLLANATGTVVGWLLLQHLRRDPALDRAAASLVLRPEAVTSS